eukprot:768334-Hanusia_phi.AAC.8
MFVSSITESEHCRVSECIMGPARSFVLGLVAVMALVTSGKSHPETRSLSKLFSMPSISLGIRCCVFVVRGCLVTRRNESTANMRESLPLSHQLLAIPRPRSPRERTQPAPCSLTPRLPRKRRRCVDVWP